MPKKHRPLLERLFAYRKATSYFAGIVASLGAVTGFAIMKLDALGYRSVGEAVDRVADVIFPALIFAVFVFGGVQLLMNTRRWMTSQRDEFLSEQYVVSVCPGRN